MTVLDEDMSECSSEISYFIDEVKLLHISKKEKKNEVHKLKNVFVYSPLTS